MRTETINVTEAYREAASAARYAPSIHNTQPWHWRVAQGALELWSVPERQLEHTDPDGRMLTISCGTALYHARVTLAALGYHSTARMEPDPERPTLLAVVTVTDERPVTPQAIRRYQTLAARHTDRRPATGEPVPADALARVAAAVAGQDDDPVIPAGAHLHVLRQDQVIELASAAGYAQSAEDADEQLRAELDYWVASSQPGLGVPATNLPASSPATTVPEREFHQPGSLPVSADHDRAANYGLLYTERDDVTGWLIAGQALAAGWIEATELGLRIMPLSAVIEVPVTRVRLRGMLTADAYPQMVIRLGNADPEVAGPPATPRLDEGATIEVEPDGDTS
jgi:hypothetical protein